MDGTLSQKELDHRTCVKKCTNIFCVVSLGKELDDGERNFFIFFFKFERSPFWFNGMDV